MNRDRGGRLLLDDTPGDIVEMVAAGDHLIIYKSHATYHCQLPDSIDPQRTNDNIPTTTRLVANIGSSSPIVARTILQGKEIVGFTNLSHEAQSQLVQRLERICEDILVCERISAEVGTRIAVERRRIEQEGLRRGAGHVVMPRIGGLEQEASNFLIHAKRVLLGAGHPLDYRTVGIH